MLMTRPPQTRIASLSIFFPAFNDGGTISSMVMKAQTVASTITDDFEILVINDFSQDDTAVVLTELKKLIPSLRVIHHSQNLGYGATLRDGFSSSTKEWIFYTDGDAQYDPLELRLLVEALKSGVDFVNGYKIRRKDPLFRIIIGAIYNFLVKIAFGLKLRDIDCDFRLIKRSVVNQVKLESSSGSICVEMIKKFQDAGFNFAQVPVSHYYRQYGKSQFFNWRRLLSTFKQLFVLWWNLVVKKHPSRTK